MKQRNHTDLKICACLFGSDFKFGKKIEQKLKAFFLNLIQSTQSNTFVFQPKNHIGEFEKLCFKIISNLSDDFCRFDIFIVKDASISNEEYDNLILDGIVKGVCLSPDIFSLNLSYQNKLKKLIDLSHCVAVGGDAKMVSSYATEKAKEIFQFYR